MLGYYRNKLLLLRLGLVDLALDSYGGRHCRRGVRCLHSCVDLVAERHKSPGSCLNVLWALARFSVNCAAVPAYWRFRGYAQPGRE